MSLYSFPAGTSFPGASPTTERTVRRASPFTIVNQYGLDAFSNPDLLLSLDIKRFVEDVVPPFYAPGAPVDVDEGDTIHRTYPNMEYDAEAALVAALDTITAKYEAKRAALVDDVARALLIDGATMEANLASLRSKWAAFADAENAEIEALFT